MLFPSPGFMRMFDIVAAVILVPLRRLSVGDQGLFWVVCHDAVSLLLFMSWDWMLSSGTFSVAINKGRLVWGAVRLKDDRWQAILMM